MTSYSYRHPQSRSKLSPSLSLSDKTPKMRELRLGLGGSPHLTISWLRPMEAPPRRLSPLNAQQSNVTGQRFHSSTLRIYTIAKNLTTNIQLFTVGLGIWRGSPYVHHGGVCGLRSVIAGGMCAGPLWLMLPTRRTEESHTSRIHTTRCLNMFQSKSFSLTWAVVQFGRYISSSK